MTNIRWRTRLLPALLLAAGFSYAGNSVAAPAPAQIVSLEGKGEYREPQQIDWRPAKVNQQLFPANLVRTGDASKMAVMFPDRTQVRLAPNSVLQIKDIAQGKEAKTILNLNAGRSWMQSKTTPGGLNVETPSATASIRGTDWEIVVDPDGRSTLTVFSGEAEFSNAQGSVAVGRNEQAVAEKGRAPVKVQVVNPRDRIQWVASTAVNPARYREADPAAQAVLDKAATEMAGGRAETARRVLTEAIAVAATDSASARLLLADFEVFDGELARAAQSLAQADSRFPRDARVPTAQARLSLLRDDAAVAESYVVRALQREPKHAEAWLARGDIARLNGNAIAARSVYQRAAEIAPADARGWLGLGLVAAEREDFAEARRCFDEALKRDARSIDVQAERATMETAAGDFAVARQSFDAALAAQPDNVVLLTGKALLELKSGDNEAALDLLLRATLIEPRYARAQLYLAVAYARQERPDRAYPQLLKVSEVDRNDPLPHFMASQMHVDALEPAAAIDEAREAVRLMPYLKSLNQLANNQAGGANLGSAMSFFGMESWARHMAQESYLPLWAGSHLFLADRYAGDFTRRSELLQGFLLDPAAFGAPNRYQPLVETPGHYAALSLRANRSDDLKLTEPVLTVNGSAQLPTTVSYFGEFIDTRIRPGNTALSANARVATVALGVKPGWDRGFFLYANRLSADADIGDRNVTGLFQQVDGYNNRVDAGGNFKLDARSQFWFKAGAGDERSTVAEKVSIILPGLTLGRATDFVTKPRSADAQLRFTHVTGAGREWTVGAEAARLRTTNNLLQDATINFPGGTPLRNTLDSTDRDRSAQVYAQARQDSAAWTLEGSLGWATYQKDRDFHIVIASPAGVADIRENYDRDRANAAIGAVLRLQPGRLLRGACQAWTRPASPGTLAPVAVAGVPIDDRLVFAGGRQSRCHARMEWEASATTFLTASLDGQRIDNLASTLDGVLNTRADVTNLDRLRNRLLPLPPKPDVLEDTPVFSRATVTAGSVSAEQIVWRSLAARFNYTYTDSRNTYDAFRDNHVPYLPRHTASLGATWAMAGRSYVSAQAVWRSLRYSDETNTAPIAAGWDAQVRATVELDRKHWTLEAYGLNLLKKDASDVFGVIATYRF